MMSLNTLTKQFFQMPTKFDNLYMDIAERLARQSHAKRAQVGCVIVKNNQIIAEGWNGTPSGWPNECEEWHPAMDYGDGTWITKPIVLHAESNALMKVAKSTQSSEGATLYTTMCPCMDCAKLITQAGITRVVYKNEYPKGTEGLLFLSASEIECEKIDNEREVSVGRTTSSTKDWRYNTQ